MVDWYIEVGGVYSINGKDVFGRKIYIDPDDIDKTIKRFNNKDAYATIYFYNDENQDNSDLYGPLYIDLDLDIKTEFDFKKIKKDLTHVVTALNTVYGVPNKYIKIYFSGNKGFHIIVPPEVLGIKPNKKLNHYYKFIAQDLNTFTFFRTVDTRIYDNKRLFRIPNTINGKTGFYKVPVDIDFVRNATFQEMLDYASTPKKMNFPEAKLVTEANIKFNEAIKKYNELQQTSYISKGLYKMRGKPLPCIESILDSGATKGNRNNTTMLLASSLFQTGLSFEQVLDKILRWNSEKNSPKLSDKEVISTVRSAEAGYTNGKQYGCGAITDLGYCIGSKCKIFDKKNKKVGEKNLCQKKLKKN